MHTWQHPDQVSRRYLAQMVAWGYEAGEVEQLLIGDHAEPAAPTHDRGAAS